MFHHIGLINTCVPWIVVYWVRLIHGGIHVCYTCTGKCTSPELLLWNFLTQAKLSPTVYHSRGLWSSGTLCLTPEDGPVGWPELSVTNYQYVRCNTGNYTTVEARNITYPIRFNACPSCFNLVWLWRWLAWTKYMSFMLYLLPRYITTCFSQIKQHYHTVVLMSVHILVWLYHHQARVWMRCFILKSIHFEMSR